MSNFHAAVWIDHNEARVFHLSPSECEAEVVVAPKAHTQLHRKLGSDSGHRAQEDQHYYHAVAQALTDADEILVVGPATAKLELVKHVHRHHAAMVAKIVGVETVDHPTDAQLLAYARRYFGETDRLPRA